MKTPSSSNAILLAIISVAIAQAQRGPAVPQMRGDGPAPEAKPFSITRTDPALDDIISPGAELVELARGFGLTEGGLWIAEGVSGYWIFAGLLDNVLYLYGSGMGNPNVHNHINLPIIVAGGAAGNMQGGRHLRYSAAKPLANLHLTLLDNFGVHQDTIGDSNGRVDAKILSL